MTLSLHDYDSHSSELFSQAYQTIHHLIPKAEIHHVGSTSIPGMGGKGMIDILIAIPDWSKKAALGQKLIDLGFTHVHKEINHRIFMSRVGETVKNDVHIHLTYIGSEEYQNILSFRNYLRSHPDEANRYADLKHLWLKQASGNRKIYTNSKNNYIASVLAKSSQPQILIEIKDNDFDPSFIAPPQSAYSTRHASRGILIHHGKLALLHVAADHYHKLPGGGMENNETPQEAFKREILEETGCDCQIDDESLNLVTHEWRGKWQLFQISHVFTAHVIGEPRKLTLTESEISRGFSLKWVPFAKIDSLLDQDSTTEYESQFITRRDRAIINHFRSLLTDK
jgi:GrpB-like predicted nucleotidyltransferase (UPF0157 family)/ADP-ribose pyrophosphatase YjhB (NUDIX family)